MGINGGLRTSGIKLRFVFFVALILVSCASPQNKRDDEIPSDVRADADRLVKQTADAIAAEDSTILISLCSSGYAKTQAKVIHAYRRYIKTILAKGDLKVKNSYYQTGLDTTSLQNVSSGTGSHDYVLNYKTNSKDVLLVLATVNDTIETIAVTLIYGKYSGDWRLQWLETGLISLSGMDAIDWYEKSRKRYDSAYYVDAVCNMSMYSRVSRPAGKMLVYNKAREMSDFQPKLEIEIGKMGQYPLVVPFVKTQPRVFNIFPAYLHGKWCPTLYYRTVLPLSDTVALAEECDAFNRDVGQRFNGLNKNNDFIIYKAFATIPDRGPARGGVEFIRKTIQ